MNNDLGRRSFLKGCTGTAALAAVTQGSLLQAEDGLSRDDFAAHQANRRKKLWGLLGELPRDHHAQKPKLVKTEQGPGYTLEYLVLDLNGVEPVPALLMVPEKRQSKAPGMLYLHYHNGSKESLLTGYPGVLSAYAPVLAEKGIVTLAIDSWCFGERNHGIEWPQVEYDTFKDMLWQGQVLWGMMMWDEIHALTYLAEREEVDANRLGAMGLSMGSTKAWWLAALDPRVKVCIDLCCLTDFDEIRRERNLRAHGLYYFVPGLLKHFSTAQINELIVPRARLSLNGRKDWLTPPQGVEKVRDYLLPLYRRYGNMDDCRIELFDCDHRELPEMHQIVKHWLDVKLVGPAV